MNNNFKNLKFYHWLTKVSPIMFEFDMKLQYDYNFFNRASYSLKFTSGYWLEILNKFLYIHRYMRPGLDLYENLPLHGELDTFIQLMLKIALFNWKFIPVMLSDLFKGYPLVGPEIITFSDTEFSLFEAWLELPVCIDELYVIILEKGWAHTMQPKDTAWTWDPYGSFDVYSHTEFIKKFPLPHPLDLGGFLAGGMVCIPGMMPLFKHWIISRNLPRNNLFFTQYGQNMLQKISKYTLELLCVNSFFDFTAQRILYDKQFQACSPEKQQSMKNWALKFDIQKKKRPYQNYDEWYTDLTKDYSRKITYPGDRHF